MKIKKGVKEAKMKDFHLKKGVLWFKRRLCAPNIAELKSKVIKEVHNSTFTAHPVSIKMYHDLKTHFWCIGMKRDMADFVAKCST